MANFKIDNDPLIGVPTPVTVTATYATGTAGNPPYPLGLHAEGRDYNSSGANMGAGVFQFCRGSDVTAAGQFVHIIGNSAVQLAAANSASKFPIGIACGALSATNVYGWVQVAGLNDSGSLSASGTSGAAGNNLWIAADTDSGQGYVQFSTGTGTQTPAPLGNLIHGVCPTAAVASDAQALGTVYLNYPMVIGLTASI